MSSVHRKHLQRSGSDRGVGVLWWVQQDLSGGAVCGSCAGQDYTGCCTQQEAKVETKTVLVQMNVFWSRLTFLCRLLSNCFCVHLGSISWEKRLNWSQQWGSSSLWTLVMLAGPSCQRISKLYSGLIFKLTRDYCKILQMSKMTQMSCVHCSGPVPWWSQTLSWSVRSCWLLKAS